MAQDKATQNKYRTISISTVLILLAGFAYYYFVYVKSKEAEFNEKAFRIIQKVGSNVEDKYENYLTVVRNASKDIDIDKVQNANELSKTSKFKSIPLDLEVVAMRDKKSFIDPPRIIPSLRSDSIVLQVQLQKKEIEITYDISNLLVNTLRRDFFKQYIIFSSSMVYYSDIATEKNIAVPIDSIFKEEQGELNNLFHSTDKVELQFNNKKQLLYVTPVNVSGTNTIYIGGLIDRQYYMQQSFQLGTNTTMFLLISIILLVFSFPFLKLLLLSEVERLSTTDAVMSFLSLIIGSAFIVISLLTFFSQSGQSAKAKKDYLEGYARQIEGNFLRELDAISAQITENELILMEMNRKGYNPLDLTGNLNSSDYSFYKLTNWMNSNGEQLVKWHRKNLTARVNVAFRNYFKVPNDPGEILWDNNSIYIESINSVTQGITYAMVSKRSEAGKLDALGNKKYANNLNPTVVCMDSKFQSMTDLPLPSNISYMVANEQGVIMFHKDPTRILQENVFVEIGNETRLRQAMVSREHYIFKGSYDGVQSRFLFLPMGNLPLYLIVYLDEELEKNNDAQILTLTSQFYLMLFLILMVQLVLFVMVDYQRKRKTKGSNLFVGWMWPLPLARKRYRLQVGFLLVAFVIYITGEIYAHVLATFAFFSLLLTVNIFILKNFSSPRLFLKQTKLVVYFIFVLLFGLLLFIVSDIHGRTLGFFIFYLVVIAATLYFSLSPLLDETRDSSDLPPIRGIFNTWVLLFILFIGVIPVFSFFYRAYNFEKAVKTIYLQKELTERLISGKFLSADASYKPDTSYKDYKTLNRSYNICTNPLLPDTTYQVSTSADSIFIDEIRLPYWSGKAGAFTAIKPDSKIQMRQLSWEVDRDSIRMRFTSGRKANANLIKVELKTKRHRIDWINFLTDFDGRALDLRIAMMLSFLILIAVLYGLISFWTSKLFLLGIIPRFMRDIDDELEKSTFSYIISPPYSKCTYFVRKLFPGKTFTIDMRYLGVSNVSDEATNLDEEKEIAMIYDTESISLLALKNKIALIHRLKRHVYDTNHKLEQIIIISPFSPHRLQRHFENNQEGQELIHQYLDIIGNFETYYFNIGKMEETGREGKPENAFKETEPMGLVDFGKLNKRLQSEGFAEEDLLLNVQNTAQLNYFALWNSLEEREKLLIYDLAQDGLVNYKNLSVIFNLLNRGILIYENHSMLKLFDDSFANFVLTIISRDEALEIEKASRQSGNWSNLRLPFFTIVLGVLIFLFTTQQELFGNLVRWLTASLALLPLISKFIASYGMFGKKSGGGDAK